MAVLPNMRVEVRRPGAARPAIRYGLFAVVQAMGLWSDALPIQARQGGLEYQTAVCDLPTGYETACLETLADKDPGATPDLIQGDPFLVMASVSCAPVGLTNDRLRQLLLERLYAGEQATLERIFSDGLVGINPSLANSTPAVPLLAASADIVAAFGRLEEDLYSAYGLPGVIHLPMRAMDYAKSAHLIEMDAAGIWRTAVGTAVVGANYSGLGPAGEVPAATAQYLYITGQVAIWRSPDAELFVTEERDALNRTTNQVVGRVEREYLLTYECRSAATLTTLALP
jgi:hypothetical protein